MIHSGLKNLSPVDYAINARAPIGHPGEINTGTVII
jgi:hypothetical protein